VARYPIHAAPCREGGATDGNLALSDRGLVSGDLRSLVGVDGVLVCLLGVLVGLGGVLVGFLVVAGFVVLGGGVVGLGGVLVVLGGFAVGFVCHGVLLCPDIPVGRC
jgi:hypothetical protein